MKHTKHAVGCGLVVGIACIGLLVGQTAAGVINILDQGAVADGTTLNTAAFQKAVAGCVKQNGGTIFVPAGIYRTGPIQLQSNVTLQLEAGAVLGAARPSRTTGRTVGGRAPWCGPRTPRT